MLKYPWLRGTSGNKGKKWGAYASEESQMAWARQTHGAGDESKCVEAELMDWADDIAYSVHDLEDFYRAGMIPLDRLKIEGSDERGHFEEQGIRNITERDQRWAGREDDLRHAFTVLALLTSFTKPFDDSKEARELLHEFSSGLITRYLSAIRLVEPRPGERTVLIDEQAEAEVLMLKQLTWQYVVDNPALAVEQHGQQRIIENLFNAYAEAVGDRQGVKMLPAAWRERHARANTDPERLRLVADFIASLTERQALRLAGRLIGHQPTSIIELAGI